MAQTKIFIGNLSYGINESALSALFETVGQVEEVSIPIDRDSGRPRGFAFVTFESQRDAQNALSLDGKDVDGRKIAVKMAEDKNRRRYA